MYVRVRIAILVLISLSAPQQMRADYPDEIEWVGNQSDCLNLTGEASWFDGLYWRNYWHPGATYDDVTAASVGQNPTQPTDDIAIFDESLQPIGNGEYHVYFGDFQPSYSLPCSSNPHPRIGGGIADAGQVIVQRGDWTFDFGRNTGENNGGMNVAGPLVVGTSPSTTPFVATATLTINGRGEALQTQGTRIADHPEAVASVIFDGARSPAEGHTRWSDTYLLSVGQQGHGSLSVTNGGEVFTTGGNSTVVGHLPGSYGELTITDQNSHFSAEGVFAVASTPGSQGKLTVANGGRLSVNYLGILGGGGASEVLLSDPGSVIEVQGQVWFGNGEDSQSVMRVQNGASFITHNFVGIGTHAPGGSSHEVIVTGKGTLWDGRGTAGGGYVTVGHDRQGRLSVMDGATVLTNIIQVGVTSGGFLGELELTGDGLVKVEQLIQVGLLPDSQGRVYVGAGGALESAAQVRVGQEGDGMLTIDQGGHVQSADGLIAMLPGSFGRVEVLKQGVWQVANNLYVGGNEVGPGGNGLLKASDDGQVSVGGELRVYEHGSVDVLGGRISIGEGAMPAIGSLRVGQSGTLSGTGEILGDVLVDGGTLIPGDSPGVLSISGDLDQAAGLLEFEIGGPMAGLDHDQLVVGGVASLRGVVRFEFIDGFTPSPGQLFQMIAAGDAVNSQFALYEFAGISDQLQLSAVVVDGVLSFLDAPLIGDTNHDGTVGLNDLNNVRNNFGLEGATILGDTNLDGRVDLQDLNNVRNNFGTSAPTNAVPEPSSLLLIGLGGIGFVAWRRIVKCVPATTH